MVEHPHNFDSKIYILIIKDIIFIKLYRKKWLKIMKYVFFQKLMLLCFHYLFVHQLLPMSAYLFRHNLFIVLYFCQILFHSVP